LIPKALGANELLDHLVKEELALFPYILSLENAEFNNQKPEIPPFKSLVHPIAMMEGEHEFAGGTFAKISELSDRFTPPKDACGSYTLLFHLLSEFEQNLHTHVHLENNILFPKAIELEKRLFSI